MVLVGEELPIERLNRKSVVGIGAQHAITAGRHIGLSARHRCGT
jgi:hypothetical protein